MGRILSLKFPVLCFSAALAATSAVAKPIRFEIKDAAQRDLVQFVSEAPLEKIVGISSAVSGWIELDPQRLQDGVKAEFEADLRTFDTANQIRDDQLRESFLLASEYPTAIFTATKLASYSKSALTDKQPISLRVDGTIKIRGIAKPRTLLVKATYFKRSDATEQRLKGNLLRVSTTFDLDLQQFGITIPPLMKYQMIRFVQVSVDAVGTDGQMPILVPVSEPAPTVSGKN